MVTRKLRRSQTLSPFGVGAIFDILGESFVAEDIGNWKGRPISLISPRLAASLSVAGFRTAPPAPDRGKAGAGLPFFRFPQQLFCTNRDCRRLTRWHPKRETGGEPPRCTSCASRRQLVPMRFVMVCSDGHLDDVDWHRWAHSAPADRDQRQCGRTELFFDTLKGVGGGLESLRVRCVCGASRNLKGIAGKGMPASVGMKCRGGQPWQLNSEREPCVAADVAIVQRGQSNAWFGLTASALDIPPYSRSSYQASLVAQLLAEPMFKALLEQPDTPVSGGIIAMLANQYGVDAAVIEAILADQLSSGPLPAMAMEGGQTALLSEEYAAFTADDEDHHPDETFITARVDLDAFRAELEIAPELTRCTAPLHHLVLATRLREVRALTGFRRLDGKRRVRPDLHKHLGWLPAVEVFGEGIFFTVDENELSTWEELPAVVERAARLAKRLGQSYLAEDLPVPDPRFILLHTIAHVLMRQLTFEAGYSSSSLRERIYSSSPDAEGPVMAGILIYTAAGDSEGTLGGLVRLGEPKHFAATLAEALQQAAWCSLDPVCRESEGQGPDSLSLAACHACGLVSETSCVHANSLLDRLMIVDPDFGFFRSQLTDLLDADGSLG